jgi:DNA-3-methyladenine glycosylase II
MTPTTLDETSLAAATQELAERDDKLAFSLQRYGPPPLWERPPGFATLVHIILEQQVSLSSAWAAFRNLEQYLGAVKPENFLSLDDATLKTIGFSRQKTRYCRLLAEALDANEFDLKRLENLPDEEVCAALTQFTGIGVWTANIYLLMALLRPDVWPKGDLALVVAWQDLSGASVRPTQDELEKHAARWQPYRSVAARLLWNHYLKKR